MFTYILRKWLRYNYVKLLAEKSVDLRLNAMKERFIEIQNNQDTIKADDF